jgi:hypothetical protein
MRLVVLTESLNFSGSKDAVETPEEKENTAGKSR